MSNVALLFETTDSTVYGPGELIEAVGIGKQLVEDDPGEFVPGMFIFGRGVHEEGEPIDAGDKCRWWYFRARDLKPLTKAAKHMYAELRRRNRHMPRHHR